MPYAEHDGTSIYYEVEGVADAPDERTIILHHGFLSDLESWRRRGWVALLRDRFRLLLMDARGHGRSDKPHDEAAYTSATRVADVTAVMDAAGAARAHYLGYSMGGVVGFCTLDYAPERFLSVTVGGASPMYDPDRHVGRAAGFQDYYQGALHRNEAVRAARDAGHHDLVALEVCRRALAYWPGAEDALRAATQPVLIYVGTADAPHAGVMRAPALNPRIEVIELPGDDHAAAAGRAEVVAPRMLAMIEKGSA